MAEDNIYKGNLYFKYLERKNGEEWESCDEAKKRLNSQLLKFKREGYLKAGDVPDEELLSFIEEKFFNGKSFTLFVKNATVGISSQCRIMEYTPQSCPFSNQSECVLNEMQNSYKYFYIRPSADRPVFDEIFPTDKILSFKCQRKFCPHSANGSILQIIEFLPVKKSDRQEDEIAVQGSMFFRDKWSTNADKPDNILKADLLRIMPSISEKSKKALQEWENYLEWRNRLVQLKNNGIRYIAKETDLEENTVTFTVIAETEEKFKRNQFWRRENRIVVRDISYSTDQWKYIHKEWKKESEKRALRIYLGEFISSEKISDETGTYTDNYRRFIPDSCPWKRPFIARLKFSLHTELKGINSTKKPPENGFITFISGDVSLIKRMKETISNFKAGKIVAAPRLSSYMFDIKKATPAEKDDLELVFFSKNLNEDQKNAVRTMLLAPEIALVQGPPGTGKTQVISEAVLQFLKQGKSVFLASQSFAAVENALDRIENSSGTKIITFRREWDEEEDKYRYFKKFLESLGVPIRRCILPQEEFNRNVSVISEKIRYIENNNGIIQGINADKSTLEKELIKNKEDLLRTDNEYEEHNDEIEELLNLKKLKEIIELGQEESDENLLVPERLRQIFVQLVSPINAGLKKAGFVDSADFESSDSRNIIRCLKGYKMYFKRKIDLLNKDIFHSMQMAKSNSNEETAIRNRMEILKRNRQKAMEDNDIEEYDRIEQKINDLKKNLKTINSKGGISSETDYRKYLGEEVYIRILSMGRQERIDHFNSLLKVLNDLQVKTAAIFDQFMSELQKEISKFKECDSILDRRKKLKYDIRQLSDKIKTCDEKIKVAQESLSSYISKTNEELKDILPAPLDNPDNALNWLKTKFEELRENREKFNTAFKDVLPLYKKWLSILERPLSDTDIDITYRSYIRSCNVVGMTCTANTRMLEEQGYEEFDVAIIDEVSKATPPEILMAMLMAKKAVLVGDHRQLPPLFGEKEPRGFEEEMISESENPDIPEEQKITSENFRKYEKLVTAALFKEYFEQADNSIKCSLFTQYRMHPDIMRIINEFYDNRLNCDEKKMDLIRSHGIQTDKISYIRPERHAYWIDSSKTPYNSQFFAEQSGTSKKNFLEALMICRTLKDLDNSLDKDIKKEVAVISFYGHQTSLIRNMLKKIHFRHFKPKVDTVDRFQGREADYVLVSLTATPKCISRHSHVAQFERVNVAFSRARELLLIYGAERDYSKIPVWLSPLSYAGEPKETFAYGRIIDNLRRLGCFVNSGNILNREDWINDHNLYKKPSFNITKISSLSFKSLSDKAAKK